MDPKFPRNCEYHFSPPSGALNNKTDPLQAGMSHVTRHKCIQTVQGALKLLQMLAEMSSMTDVEASTLTRWLSKASEARTGTETKTGMNEMDFGQVQEILDTTSIPSQTESTSAVGEVAS